MTDTATDLIIMIRDAGYHVGWTKFLRLDTGELVSLPRGPRMASLRSELGSSSLGHRDRKPIFPRWRFVNSPSYLRVDPCWRDRQFQAMMLNEVDEAQKVLAGLKG